MRVCISPYSFTDQAADLTAFHSHSSWGDQEDVFFQFSRLAHAYTKSPPCKMNGALWLVKTKNRQGTWHEEGTKKPSLILYTGFAFLSAAPEKMKLGAGQSRSREFE